MKEKIILLGCGGHAKSVADAIEAAGQYAIEGFVDNAGQEGMGYRGYKVIGCDRDLKDIYRSGIQAACVCVGFLGQGQGQVRNKLYEQLKNTGYKLPAIIDPNAALALDAEIGEGTFIGKYAVVNANAVVGKMAIINTAAAVEHDCVIGEFSHIAVGGIVCGSVYIGKEVLIGANATILQGITIGDGAIIGAGSIVSRNVEENMKIRNRVVPVCEKLKRSGVE